MNSRRDFIRSTALGAAVAALPRLLADGPATVAGRAAAPALPLGAGRKDNGIAERHRNLFNGDSCVYFYNPELCLPEGGPFSAKAIHRYVEVLAQSGIDTFLINPNAERAWYPSKVIPTIIDGYKRGDREYFRGHASPAMVAAMGFKPADVDKFLDYMVVFFNQYLDLVEAGVDWLAETSQACRKQGVAPWVSVRMNDLHGYRNFKGSFFNLPILGREEMRLHHSTYPFMGGDWDYRQGLNYEKPEVRELMFKQIKEVVEDYDFEGLELDWWRQPLCCEPVASARTVAMMSDWFREVRALTERRAQKNGRPYYFGMRIPGNLETLKSIGIDVQTLSREGTLDFVCPSGFWRTTWDMPHDDLRRQLGERTAVYGVIEDGANALPAYSPEHNLTREIRFISASREMLYANAAGKLVLGASGIEWFNFFCTDQVRLPGIKSDYTFLHDIYRLDYLRGREKHYTFANRGGILELPPFEAAPKLPVVLEQNWRQAFRLPMCAEPADRGLQLVVQVVLKKSEPLTGLPVSFNGSWPEAGGVATALLLFPCGSLTHHIPDHIGYNFHFPVSLLQEGWNEVILENGGKEPLTIVCIEVAVMAAAGPRAT